MIKTQKTRFAALLLVLVTLFSALFIPIHAAGYTIDSSIGNELTPVMSRYCSQPIYVTESIPLHGLEPNTTYYYVNQDRSITYSWVITDNYRNTSIRYDLVSYNGEGSRHGDIIGAHIHYYSWEPYTNSNGVTYYNKLDETIHPYH